jgi:hypothetical protein
LVSLVERRDAKRVKPCSLHELRYVQPTFVHHLMTLNRWRNTSASGAFGGWLLE